MVTVDINLSIDTSCDGFFLFLVGVDLCLLVGVDVIRFENPINPTAC